MTIARIEIDFTLNEGEDLDVFLEAIGDMVVGLLDPHDNDEDQCERWVSIEAYEMKDDEYEIDTTVIEEIEEFLEIPDEQRDHSEYN